MLQVVAVLVVIMEEQVLPEDLAVVVQSKKTVVAVLQEQVMLDHIVL